MADKSNITEDNEWGISDIDKDIPADSQKYDFDRTSNMPTKEVSVDLDEIIAGAADVPEEAPVNEYADAPEIPIAVVPKEMVQEETEEVFEETPVVLPEDDEESEKEKKERKAFIISTIIALILIILVGAYILVKLIGGNGSSDKGQKDKPQQTITVEDDSDPDDGSDDEELTECEKNGHDWSEATCTEPKTCKVCGTTEGEASGHDFEEATCTTPKTCKVCKATEGQTIAHTFEGATCTEPATCKVCGETGTEATGHSFLAATCTEPKTCSICGETEGEALGHSFLAATCTAPKTCSRCGATEGSAANHSYEATQESIVGTTKTVTYTCSVCGGTKTETTEMPVTPSDSDYANQVLALVNADRAKEGLAPLTLSAELCNAANLRAQEIVTDFSHTRPDGSSCFTVIPNYGSLWCAENIAAGQSTPSEVETAWMKSSGHKANILGANYTKLGVGYYETTSGYRYYWVQLFSS